MSDAAPASGHAAGDTAGHDTGHGTGRAYLWGFLLSVVLTGVPFWMVMAGGFDRWWTIAAVIGCAVAQILVHTVCFLHVNTRAEGGWQLMAYVFTGVLVLIVIAGSLWIMTHLHTNMMPMAPAGAGPGGAG
jgi:cytochrome o ubiquinol oxidase subunit IV